MKKHLKIIILVILSLLLLALLFSYGYWQIEVKQKNDNQLAVQCIDISITNEENAISLKNQYPISDEEGATLTPYTFTVSNNCNKQVDYQIDLELLGTADTSASASYMKVMLDNKEAGFLNDYPAGLLTLPDAFESYQIGFGRLEAKGTDGDSDTHSLRLWVDFDTPISEKDKVFKAKVTVSAGQDLEYVFDEGTLAYDILAQHGGLRNTGIQNFEFRELIERKTSQPLYFRQHTCWDDYEVNTESGLFILKGNSMTVSSLEECFNDHDLCYSYCIRNNGTYQAVDGVVTRFDEYFWDTVSEDDDTSYYNIESNHYTFEKIGTDEIKEGINMKNDDYGVSYYLDGTYENNHVQFGYLSATDNSGSIGNPMYWKIVRINGDGTIRLIYNGVAPYSNDLIHNVAIANSYYNTSLNVGYTYEDANGNQVDSTIKGVVDDWYETNLKINYEKYIADRIFCDDKAIFIELDNKIYYNSYFRNRNYYNFVLTCKNDEDKYTVSSDYGNGYLTYPIGLITMDEIGLAKIKVKNVNYWAMTPYIYDSSSSFIGQYFGGKAIGGEEIDKSYGVRPVINLKADVEFTGKGTINDPYVIKTN